MADLDNDKDLERAIALSLAYPQSADPPSEDDDDDELQRALALSQQKSEQDINPLTSTSSNSESSPFSLPDYAPVAIPDGDKSIQPQPGPSAIPTTKNTAFQPSALSGMDRRAMEKERLARLGKRKRHVSSDRPLKLVVTAQTRPTMSDESQKNESHKSVPWLQYPKGVIKRTWAHKYPRSNDAKIEEILQATDLKIAVLSAFQWEDRWIFSKLNPYKIKQYWFMNAKGEDLRKKIRYELEEMCVPNLMLHFPPMDGQTINMHSKLMLLFHEDYLRVVVPTANMIKVDWGETNADHKGVSWQPAVMENSVFLVDLPRRSGGEPAKEAETAFGENLLHFLRSQGAPSKVTTGLLKFDFSVTEHLAFVHSMYVFAQVGSFH
jgi:hypothetical protein